MCWSRLGLISVSGEPSGAGCGAGERELIISSEKMAALKSKLISIR